MKVSMASLVKSVIACIAPAAVLLFAGCDTTAHSGVFAILDTSASFVRDFLLSVLAAVLL